MTSRTTCDSLRSRLCTLIDTKANYSPLMPWVNRIIFTKNENDSIDITIEDPVIAELFTDDLRLLMQSAILEVESQSERSKTESDSTHRRFRFDNFFTGPGNRLALAAAKSITHEPATKYNPLVLYGNIGLGKTHLLQAIYEETNSRSETTASIYLSTSIFIQEFHAAVEANELHRWRRSFDSFQYIILDDVQRICNHPSAQTELLQLFEAWYAAEKQLVFSMISPAQTLSILPALKNRLQWGLVVEIQLPVLESRQKLIEQKCITMGLYLSEEIISFMAEQSFHNIRELEGFLHKLQSHSDLLHKTITIKLVKSLLPCEVRPTKRIITIAEIQECICKHFGIRIEALLSKSRIRSIAFPRQIGMYLSKIHTTASLEEIGQAFGHRDHSTVKHGYDKIVRLLKEDDSLKQTIQQLDEFLMKDSSLESSYSTS